jgi:pimeloyl-ACP methyl ester carboxylesterase
LNREETGTSTFRLTVRQRGIEAAWWGHASADRTPIVLLHEGLGSVAMWRDFPAAVAERTSRRVMAYSRFGHGWSDPPSSRHTIQFMHEEAERLPEILDAAAISRAIVLGHSDGGSIALIFAAQHATRTAALILEAPHVFVEDVSVASIERTTAEYAAQANLRSRLGRYHANVDSAFRGWSDVWLDPTFREWNLEPYLPRITCPVLLIQGQQDEYGTLRQIDAIQQQVTGPVERLVLPDCGHSPHRDQKDTVLAAIAEYVAAIA